MTWPSDQDYNEAIQNPQFCFEDFDLKAGHPDETPLGLPKAISGNYASVYKVKTIGKTYAVRCFSKSVASDQEKRYSLISNYLRQYSLPYMVEFKYLPRGIKIRGEWYPIVKMEWLEGMQLNRYLENNLNNPQILQELAKKFLKLTDDLKSLSIAHGDLQHGNILIVHNDIRLIDYDGMFVPGMEGLGSHELGNRHFQHPKRDEYSFGPYVDTFSTWVIYISILALSFDSRLWNRLQAGVDNLLFKKEDFDNFYSSQTYNTLETVNNPQIKLLIANFRNLVASFNLQSFPTLIDTLKPFNTNLKSIPVNQTNQAGIKNTWLNDYIPPNTFSRNDVSVPNKGVVGASWVLDFVELPKKLLEPNLKHEWGVVFTLGMTFPIFLAIAVFGFINLFFGIFLSFLPLVSLWFYYWQNYKSHPIHKEKAQISQKIYEVKTKMDDSYNKTRFLQNNKQDLTLEENKRTTDLINSRGIDRAEHAEILRVDRDLTNNKSKNDAQRNNLVSQEQAEINQIRQTLKSTFEYQIKQKLTNYRIATAKISGIGPNMVSRLSYYGINTAADIIDVKTSYATGRYSSETCNIVTPKGEFHVDGIGRQKGYSLLYWKRDVENDIRKTTMMPSSQAQENDIRNKYQALKQNLFNANIALEKSAMLETKAIVAKYDHERNLLTQQISNMKDQFRTKQHDLEKLIFTESNLKSHLQWEITKIENELKSYDKISFKEYLKYTYLSPLLPIISLFLK